MIEIKKTKERQTCNCCKARNYDTKFCITDTKRVNIAVGGNGSMVICLCGECLARLHKEIEKHI